jgi:hypothetical protein
VNQERSLVIQALNVKLALQDATAMTTEPFVTAAKMERMLERDELLVCFVMQVLSAPKSQATWQIALLEGLLHLEVHTVYVVILPSSLPRVGPGVAETAM